jgi:hypothetical protein
MALTNNCDIFGSIHEAAFNNVVRELQRQRPSLFNYGTISFVLDRKLFCDQAILSIIDSDVLFYGNPVVTQQPLLSIPGAGTGVGLELLFPARRSLHRLPSRQCACASAATFAAA